MEKEMVYKLAKRLHEVQLCEFLKNAGVRGVPWCKGWEQHIRLAASILGDEYVFLTIEEYTNLREVVVTV